MNPLFSFLFLLAVASFALWLLYVASLALGPGASRSMAPVTVPTWVYIWFWATVLLGGSLLAWVFIGEAVRASSEAWR